MRAPGMRVTLVCGEPRLPYDRVRLSELLLEDESADALELRPAEWYADRGVEALLGRRAVGLDPGSGTLALDDGSTRRFDRVALATGSRPLLPPVEGIDKPGVVAFRGPEDCDAIRRAVSSASRVAVIGGGLLGLEAARGVAGGGAPLPGVHPVDQVVGRPLDPDPASLPPPAP